MPGQVLMTVENWGDYEDESRLATGDIDTANLITSRVDGFEDKHRPVIDLDLPAKLIPSTTPGHFHLYIDKDMTWSEYDRLLSVMVEVGLVEPGYVEVSRERGYTGVRLPWVRKPTTVDVTCPPCRKCGNSGTLTVPASAHKSWVAGTHAQYAFPRLTADEREMLISGTHPACWDAMMGPDE